MNMRIWEYGKIFFEIYYEHLNNSLKEAYFFFTLFRRTLSICIISSNT